MGFEPTLFTSWVLDFKSNAFQPASPLAVKLLLAPCEGIEPPTHYELLFSRQLIKPTEIHGILLLNHLLEGRGNSSPHLMVAPLGLEPRTLDNDSNMIPFH